MVMKRLIVVTGAAIAFLCAASALSADPRDSVDRGDRLDRDAIRDDVRIDRLKIPEHPIAVEQPQQPTPALKKKPKPKKNAGNSQ
jgi:hypothetical protein